VRLINLLDIIFLNSIAYGQKILSDKQKKLTPFLKIRIPIFMFIKVIIINV